MSSYMVLYFHIERSRVSKFIELMLYQVSTKHEGIFYATRGQHHRLHTNPHDTSAPINLCPYLGDTLEKSLGINRSCTGDQKVNTG